MLVPLFLGRFLDRLWAVLPPSARVFPVEDLGGLLSLQILIRGRVA